MIWARASTKSPRLLLNGKDCGLEMQSTALWHVSAADIGVAVQRPRDELGDCGAGLLAWLEQIRLSMTVRTVGELDKAW